MALYLSDIRSFLLFFWKQFESSRCRQEAAVLTYTSLFAIVPMMAVTYVVLSWLPQDFLPKHDALNRQVESFIFSNLLPDTGSQVKHYLDQFSHQARKLTIPGIAMLVITSLMMLRTVEETFNAIWNVKRGHRGLLSLLRYWAVISLGPILLGAGLMLSTYLMSLNFLDDVGKAQAFKHATRLLPWLLTSSALCVIYLGVPNHRVALAHAATGALIAGLGFELAKSIFALIIKHSSYTLIYGAFASVPLFLLWIDLCWMIVLAGAVLVRSLDIYPRTLPSTLP